MTEFLSMINGFDFLLIAIIIMVHHRKAEWKRKYFNRDLRRKYVS